ncbi:MAG: alpha/beta fold hydrolase [Actinobacteria bacterium]|nr:MAG: alpha/beta fold hydrolase [Actinomycetota bacterium]
MPFWSCWWARPGCSRCSSWSNCSERTPGGPDGAIETGGRARPSRSRGVPLRRGPVGLPAPARVHGVPRVDALPFGRWLSSKGFSVIGPRLPGHGTTWEDLETTTWRNWESESEAALLDLASRCDTVIAVGLSMGGAMVLHLGAKHPDKLKGIVTINADVRRPELVLTPVVRLFMRTAKGVGNDIKKPGQDEIVYERVPLRAASQLGKFYRVVQRELPSMRLPLLVFSSVEDHLVKPSNSKYVYERAGSDRKELVPLLNSYHVATLDFDAGAIAGRPRASA